LKVAQEVAPKDIKAETVGGVLDLDKIEADVY